MRRPLLLLTLLALVLSVILAGSALTEAAPGSNSVNAKRCQKGGYATLARSTDPATAFTTEKACTSYAAQGGLLVAYTPPTPTPVPPTATPVPLSTGCRVVTGFGTGYTSSNSLLGFPFVAGEVVSITGTNGVSGATDVVIVVNSVEVARGPIGGGAVTYTIPESGVIANLTFQASPTGSAVMDLDCTHP